MSGPSELTKLEEAARQPMLPEKLWLVGQVVLAGRRHAEVGELPGLDEAT